MNAVDKYLPAAIEFIEVVDNGFLPSADGEIPKVFKGYVASFGTILKQSGLLPAAVLFSQESERSESSKRPITNAIFAILSAQSELVSGDQNNFLEFARENRRNSQARKETIYAAVALKLALRTFKIEK